MEQVMSDWLGASPKDVAKSLLSFDRSAELLSSDGELLRRYAQKWIGVYSGEVKVACDDLETLLETLDSQGVPRAETVVRFIEKEQRILIL